MVSMKKQDVVKLMTDYMMELNLDAAKSMGMDNAEYKYQLQGMYPQIEFVNGKVYDLLVDKGIIS